VTAEPPPESPPRPESPQPRSTNSDPRPEPSALKSSARVSAAVMASRVLGVARDSLFAALFGATWLADAYVIAFRIPNLLRDLFAEGALSSAFVPTFAEAFTRDGKDRAFQLANRVLTGALLCTGLLTLAGVVFAGPITHLLSHGFRGEAAGQVLTTQLTRIMMPILALISVSAVFMGVLNSQRRYTAPAYAPAMFNVTSIAAGLGLWALGTRGAAGILIWSASTTVAALVQALWQLPALLSLGYRPRLQAAGLLRDPAVGRIVRLMGPASIGLAAIQVNVLVNTHFAARLHEGSQLLLQCAFRLFYLPVGVFGVAMAVVTTTQVANEAARGDRQALRARTAEGSRSVSMLALGSAVGLMVLAEPVVSVLFERGRFHVADVRATVPILQAYMLGVLPYSLVKIYAPSFYALDRPRVPMLASICAVACNVAFSSLAWRRLGAPGLALGTTVAALVNYSILRISFARLLGPLPPAAAGTPGPGRFRLAAALVLAGAVLAGVSGGLWRGAEWLWGGADGRIIGMGAWLWLLVTITGGFLSYALTLRALGYPGAAELLRLPGRIFSRFAGRR
jgi:putative peptidoglycan lipid II flippase